MINLVTDTTKFEYVHENKDSVTLRLVKTDLKFEPDIQTVFLTYNPQFTRLAIIGRDDKNFMLFNAIKKEEKK